MNFEITENYCLVCNTNYEHGKKFCGHCGSALILKPIRSDGIESDSVGDLTDEELIKMAEENSLEYSSEIMDMVIRELNNRGYEFEEDEGSQNNKTHSGKNETSLIISPLKVENLNNEELIEIIAEDFRRYPPEEIKKSVQELQNRGYDIDEELLIDINAYLKISELSDEDLLETKESLWIAPPAFLVDLVEEELKKRKIGIYEEDLVDDSNIVEEEI